MDLLETDLVGVDYPRVVLLAVLVVANLALIGTVAASSSPYGPYNGDWNGGSELRTVAGDEATVTVVQSTDAYETASTETVAFVVAPQERYGSADRARMRQFVQRGGTLVVASEDERTNALLDALNVDARIDGALLRDEQENHRNASLPVATGVVDHDYTDDVDGLTLNYGSALNVTAEDGRQLTFGWQGQYLVNSSGFAYLDRNRNQQLDDDELLRERPVAVAEPIGAGQVVVVSDASAVANAMLDREGNRQFARNIARSHEAVLLDYSHGHPLPPLLYALLVLRATPWLQFALGVGVTGGVALWARGVRPPTGWLPRRGRGRAGAESAAGRLEEDELVAFLRSEHPDWDDDRVQRVTKAIIRRREQRGDDD